VSLLERGHAGSLASNRTGLRADASANPSPDLNSGLRVFYRDSAEHTLPLLPDGFSCTSTMTLDFLLQGRHVLYQPITDTFRLLRQAHYVLAHHTNTPIPSTSRSRHQLPAN